MNNIFDYINKTIFGHELDLWNYDESMELHELKKNNLPYAMICHQINENTIIAMDTEEESPRDYFLKNQYEKFELNPMIAPRLVKKSFLGEKNIFYLQKILDTDTKAKSSNELIIYGFKENSRITGSIKGDSKKENLFKVSFELLQKKLDFLETKKLIYNNVDETIRFLNDSFIKDYYNFYEKNIGSFIFKVNLLEKENEFNVLYENSLSTYGLSFFELKMIVQNIHDKSLKNIE